MSLKPNYIYYSIDIQSSQKQTLDTIEPGLVYMLKSNDMLPFVCPQKHTDHIDSRETAFKCTQMTLHKGALALERSVCHQLWTGTVSAPACQLQCGETFTHTYRAGCSLQKAAGRHTNKCVETVLDWPRHYLCPSREDRVSRATGSSPGRRPRCPAPPRILCLPHLTHFPNCSFVLFPSGEGWLSAHGAPLERVISTEHPYCPWEVAPSPAPDTTWWESAGNSARHLGVWREKWAFSSALIGPCDHIRDWMKSERHL